MSSRAAVHVRTRYPRQWQELGELALFATSEWQEVMAGRIEGEPHWFWTEKADALAPVVEAGFAGTLVRDAEAYVWGNPPALLADPASPLMDDAVRARMAGAAVVPADLLPCMVLTYPGYASFPIGALAYDDAAVGRLLAGIADWGRESGLASIALPYTDGSAQLVKVARSLGYEAVRITAEYTLQVGPGGFAGYLERLPTARRRKIAAERRHLSAAGVVGRPVSSVSGELFERLVDLRCGQRRKYSMPVDRPAEAARMERFLRLLANRVTVFVVEETPGPDGAVHSPGAIPSEVSVFSMFARDGATWHGMYVGADYDHPHSKGGYFEALFYAPLDAAQERGVSQISYGHAAGQAKQLRGCAAVPVECLLLGLATAAASAARRTAAAWSG